MKTVELIFKNLPFVKVVFSKDQILEFYRLLKEHWMYVSSPSGLEAIYNALEPIVKELEKIVDQPIETSGVEVLYDKIHNLEVEVFKWENTAKAAQSNIEELEEKIDQANKEISRLKNFDLKIEE